MTGVKDGIFYTFPQLNLHMIFPSSNIISIPFTKRSWLAFVYALVVLSLLQSCSSTQFLDRSKGEMFLVKNEIEFAKKTKNKSSLTNELLNQARLKPNGKFFWIPRQYFYLNARRDTIDKSKLGKWAGRFGDNNFGEPPVFFDSLKTVESSKAMVSYLQNRGYFHADVDEQIKLNKRKTKVKVTYKVNPGGLFKVDTIRFLSTDTAVLKKVNAISDNTFLSSVNAVDVRLYNQEVSRITRYLRNHGYAYFYPQYISNLESPDSSNTALNAVLELEILPPPGKEKHQSYTVGDIYINPNFDPSSSDLEEADTTIQGFLFALSSPTFQVKPKTLINSISFKTGEKFDQSKVDNTVRQLGTLGVFRPPSVRYEEDPEKEGVVNFEILLTPNKKWEFGADFDVSNTVGNSVGLANNLFGISVTPSLRNRNFLQGAELLVANTNFGIELAPLSDGTAVNSLDLRVQGDLYFPRFVDYFGLWKGLRNVNVINEGFHERLKQRANSRFSSSYNFLRLFGNYRLNFFNMAYGYDLQLNSTDRLSINHFGIDFLIPNIDPDSRFDTLLQDNPFLANSFSRQFITGLLFRDITYTYTNGSATDKSYWYLRSYLDVSGLEIMAANAAVNGLSGNSDRFTIQGADFSHYVKIEMDGRHYFDLGRNRSLVTRINGGIVRPYYSSEVPYVKQFYVGGPTSIRGWFAREIGPGSYNDPDPPTSRNLFYQAADMKFEFNIEYRFFLTRPLGFFDMHAAVFLDGGNIWTFGKDPNRPGSEFSLTREVDPNTGEIITDNFIREMALSTGFGLRMDFTYFIFRLDLGTPLRNNYRAPDRGDSYWFDRRDWQVSNIFKFQNLVPNFGLGYPF